ncbi:MAG: amino-acid N-acetyltransferase [Verrucomicrobiota bacterium]
MDDSVSQIKPTDLRGILNYVPRFLGQTFVIAFDGAIIEHPNLPNILLDIAVLRSLQINVVIVHGVGKQIRQLSEDRSLSITNPDGNGPTDATTLDLAIRASSRVSHQILEALTQSGLKCAITNSIRAAPIGVIKGEDQQFSAKVDRIDAEFLKHLISQSIVPIVQPIGFDRDGHTLRINSDLLAIEAAYALKATKVIYISEDAQGITLNGKLKRQLPVDALESLLSSSDIDQLSPGLQSKARHALKAVKREIARIHILDGSIHDGLIREVFSNEGVGTLIYGNEYQQIRPATHDDVTLIYHLTRSSVAKEELAARSIDFIETNIDDYYLYEIDGNLIACVLLGRFDDDPQAREINSLFVHPFHQKQGIGLKLVNFACHTAKSEGADTLFALTTQSLQFFKRAVGFEESESSQLPASRLHSYQANQRASKVLIKKL